MSQAVPTTQDAYTRGREELPLLQQTLGDNLRGVSSEHPDALALADDPTGREWTYVQLQADVDRAARALMAAGYERGDRLGLWAANVPQWTVLQYACATAGVILVNLNPAYRTHELAFVVGQCTMKGLVVAAPDARTNAPAIAREVAAGAPALADLILLPSEPDAASLESRDRYAHATGASPDSARELTWDQLLGLADGVDAAALAERAASLDVHDPANLQYTSGTTGFPKGVTLTHHNLLNNGFHIAELLDYSEADAVVLPVPYFHCFGMVIGNIAALSHGAGTVIPSRSFEPAAALASVQRHRATSLYGVPTMFIAELALADFEDYDLSSLRTGVMAGSPCPVEVMTRVIERMNMSEVAICYGMTETSPVSTMTRRDDTVAARTRTVGRTMPALESKIVDPATGELLTRGRSGELCTRGYAVMAGYWEEPEKTAEAIDEDGWMHTGDLASMDEDGYIAIEGRIKDLIIRGGENISPREVEEFLYTHPLIQDVQVIGVPDERYGEEIMACVILTAGAEELSIDDLRAFAAGKIAHYKVPRYLRVLTEFPMTVSGKVRKVQMREEAAAELGVG